MRYPRIDENVVLTLKVIKGYYEKEGDDYFDDRECPYGGVVKDFIRECSIFGLNDHDGEGSENIFEGEDVVEVEVLDRQIQKILTRLDKMEKELGGLEPNERLAFFKTRTALLEKLILLREKTDNLRMLGEFRSVVVRVLEDVCDADQIAEFRKRLGGV